MDNDRYALCVLSLPHDHDSVHMQHHIMIPETLFTISALASRSFNLVLPTLCQT